MTTESTLHQVLRSIGWSTRQSSFGRKVVIDEAGAEVIDGTAGAVWALLRERNLFPKETK